MRVVVCDCDHTMRTGASCANNEYACASGECITYEQLCDNKQDCADNSDEVDYCSKHTRSSFFVKQISRPKPVQVYTIKFTSDQVNNCTIGP